MPGQRLGKRSKPAVRAEIGPGRQGAVAQRPFGVADQQGRGGPLLNAEPFARPAPAQRTVEGKVMRIERLEATAAAVASEVLTELLNLPLRLWLLVVHIGDVHDTPAQIH